ncbi:MAG: helix-turn-helix transcriptional regulator [Christensenellales bacterium]
MSRTENTSEKRENGLAELENRYIRGYLYCVAMNEALRNLPEESISIKLDLFGVRCEFDVEHFYCCLAGLSERVYSTYGVSTQEYVEIFIAIRRVLLEEFRRCRYAVDIFLETHCDTNKIAILFSPKNGDCIPPVEMAERVSNIVQREYEKRLFKGKGRHCNFTALSDRHSGYEGIRASYQQAKSLGDYSFFFRSPVVVTEKDIAQCRKEVDYHSVMVACMEVKLALANGAKRECLDCLKALFDLLRDSLRYSFFRSALAYLENMLEIYCAVYDTEGTIDAKRLCDIDAYDYLEDCLDVFTEVMERLFAHAEGKARYSGVVQTALYYIKHYFKSNISLSDIAKYAEITPSYLSTLFKREVGIPISEYMMRQRIEEAKKLLAQSEKKVSQIALEVGFHDIKYFGRAFREKVSMCPVEYRESARQSEGPSKP